MIEHIEGEVTNFPLRRIPNNMLDTLPTKKWHLIACPAPEDELDSVLKKNIGRGKQ